MGTFSTSEFKLDHIGIAVNSLKEGANFYRALGMTGLVEEVVPTEKVKVAMFELANGARIELLEPTVLDSPVGRFLEKRGPGIHHICLRVRDIRRVLNDLKSQGVELINEEPVPGAHGCEVAFVHPRATGGVLVELSQSLLGHKDD